VVGSIRQAISESVELRSEQRLGFTARRAAILAAVVCVLTLTIAGPVRTYFAQRTEMNQLAAMKSALQQQITDLEQLKTKQQDPAYIAAQARERLGFVKPGETPYQVQVPATADVPAEPGAGPGPLTGHGPWYAALWHTIADQPHGPPPPPPPPPSPPPPGPAGG
jgi:cell division protein FtsB